MSAAADMSFIAKSDRMLRVIETVGVSVALVAVLVAFPQIILWLPSTMKS